VRALPSCAKRRPSWRKCKADPSSACAGSTRIFLFRPEYYVSEEAVRDSISAESIFNLIHNESVIKVDCIVRKNTPYRHIEFDRRKQIKIENFSIWIASKEDLIISKLSWAKDSGSEIQMRDVKNLIATGCDSAYVENWTRELGLINLWQQCRP
jgi:hypothetical protein